MLLLSRFKVVIINNPPAMRDRQCFSLEVNAVRISSFVTKLTGTDSSSS